MNSNSVLINSAVERLIRQAHKPALDIVDEGTLAGLRHKGLVVISQDKLGQLLQGKKQRFFWWFR